MSIYSVTNSVACYMFRPPNVAIFMEVFFEGHITKRAKNNLIYKQTVKFSTCDKRGPCHHGMARPQVADGGTVSNMECSCEYIE